MDTQQIDNDNDNDSTGTRSPARSARVRVFVDFWNFQLTMRSHLRRKGLDDRGARGFMGALRHIEGVHVVLKERRRKNAPCCPTCHTEVERCTAPACGAAMRGTMEKGIDTAIVTDMIDLAWEDAWDVAVLLSADADFIPTVARLARRGLVVLQAGFPPLQTMLARACAGAMDISNVVQEIPR